MDRMSRSVVAGLGLMTALVLTGCGAEGADETGDAAPVEVLTECVAASECTTLEPREFADLVAEDGVVLLDVRTPEEFAEGHLDGALNIDVSSPDFPAQIAELDPAATYAVYCRSGNRSQTAMTLMAEAGIDNTADLGGGIGAWAQAGLPISAG